jgi:general secretion pathway protein D
MTSVIKYHARGFMLSVATAALLTSSLQADCTYELFNISSVKGTSVGEFVDQISDECGISIIVADPEAEKILSKQMNKTFLKNLTLNEVLDLIIKENNLQYTLQNNVLKISYLSTKTYNIDYIISERKGVGSANITLSSNTSTSVSNTTGTSGGAGGGNASSESGIKITSSDEVQFWETLDKEVESILNRPEDGYTAALPMINKNAGLITVTATAPQLKRLDSYLDDLEKKMQTQVLIDVKMYSVIFSDASSTGIDWSQLYALQNVDLAFDAINTKDVTTFTSTPLKTGTAFSEFMMYDGRRAAANVFQLSAGASINEVIKFLKTQGDVYSISNPKILTLNNQTALITAGTELFYKTKNSTSTTAASTTTAETEVVSSVFSGVLLDITPEISKDGTITLRVNPSISETASQVESNNAARSMPPDLSRRQMSSVISVKDGSRVILGGLINTKNTNDANKVPLLGDIPVLGYLFKREGMVKRTEEIVIIIEPHIIKKEKDTVSLGDLGYTRLGRQIEEDSKGESK